MSKDYKIDEKFDTAIRSDAARKAFENMFFRPDPLVEYLRKKARLQDTEIKKEGP